jgi:multidrug efflux pump subunit AcrB
MTSETKSGTSATEGTGLTGAIIRYYRLFLLAVVGLTVAGVWAFISLPRTEDPEFDSTEARIITLYPGVDAREIETQVTRRIEEAIEELEGIRTIESQSSGGLSLIKIRIADSAEPSDVLEDMRQKVRDTQKELPQGVREPIVLGLNTAYIPVSIVALTGPDDYRLLDRWSETVKKRLAELDDVAAVEIEALPERQIVVSVDNARLSQYRIPLTRIRDVLGVENAAIPAGKLDVGTRRFLLRTPNEFESLDAIGSTVIAAAGGSIVQLRDVATVAEGYEDYRYIARTNGRAAVLITARKKDKTNTVTVAERVRERVEELKGTLPEGLEMRIINDRGLSVAALLSNLGFEAVTGGALVIAMVGLFLGPRQAVVVSLSLPLSILVTFLLMYLTSIDLHQMSIFGLVLAIGNLVDAGLCVVESIEDRLEKGQPLAVSVSDGVAEMAWPVISSNLAIMAAFVPMLYMSGIIGDFIFAMPVTLIYSLSVSTVVALTIVPLLCYTMFLRRPPVAKDSQETLSRAIEIYHRVAKWALRHRVVTLGLAVLSFAISVWIIPKLGIQYFPKAEKMLFLINVRLPTDANLDTTTVVVKQVEEVLAAEPEIDNITSNIGKGSPRVYYSEEPEDETPSYAQIVVNLKESFDGSVDDYVAGLGTKLEQVSGATIQTKILQQGPQAGAPIQIRIIGDDLDVLADLARQVKDRIGDVPGIVDLRDTLGEKVPQLKMDFDREKAGRLGVDTFSFARTLLMALSGEVASQYRAGDEDVPLVVRISKGTIREVSDLNQVYLPSASGAVVPFPEVATIRQQMDFARIGRRDGRRSVIVQSDVSGRLVFDVMKDVRLRLGDADATSSALGRLVDRVRGLIGFEVAAPTAGNAPLPLPLGYELGYGGESEERDESFRSLGNAMIIGFLIIFAILALQFNSFVQPVIILLTIPFGIVGAVLGLVVTNNPFGFMAFIGIVGLSGMVINASILLCDYANYLQRVEGKGIYESLLLAGRRRMRPVMLTTFTTVVGLIPAIIWGGSLWSPLASAMAFGQVFSAVLILLVLPVIYSFLVRPAEGRREYRVLARMAQRLLRARHA